MGAAESGRFAGPASPGPDRENAPVHVIITEGKKGQLADALTWRYIESKSTALFKPKPATVPPIS